MALRLAENMHAPVLVEEAVAIFNGLSGTFVDATIGLGGHSEALLVANPGVRLIGIDQDLEAIDFAHSRLARFGDRVTIVHSNFERIGPVIHEAGLASVDGILADLGVSSLQLDSEERGFSFRYDAPLDMRMDASSDGPTAAELLANLSETEIADVIYRFGEERFSRKIARWIVERREAGRPVSTTRELAELIERAVRKKPRDQIHPATRTFQALRIAVNREIEILDGFLVDAIGLLKSGGRLAVITFHSLEDRVVKKTFQKSSGRCSCPPRIPKCICGAQNIVEILTRKPIVPTAGEIEKNPRSRSAKLRAVQKLNRDT